MGGDCGCGTLFRRDQIRHWRISTCLWQWGTAGIKTFANENQIPQRRFLVECEYSLVSLLEQVVAEYQGKILSSEYTDKVTFELSLPAVEIEKVEKTT